MTDYFNDPKNVDNYFIIAEGYDGQKIITILRSLLKPGSSVLELGMGPGKDFDILSENYEVTGSDYSKVFVELYKKKNPQADVLELDAISLNIDKTFDCIYSNKVLHHLSREDLKKSFARQFEVLNTGGLLCHSFWYGDKEEIVEEMKFQYYTEPSIKPLFGSRLEIIHFSIYSEISDDDSFLIILKKC